MSGAYGPSSARIPAVIHIDGLGRLQTVTREQNPCYHQLIETFEETTGVPIPLNSSFDGNEPVVCHPEVAFDRFLRTSIDALMRGDVVAARR